MIWLYWINCYVQLWYCLCSFSKNWCSRKMTCVFFCWPTFVFVYIFLNQRRHALKCLRKSVQFPARELGSETISCIIGCCPYQNKPRLSWSLHLRQKKVSAYNLVEHTHTQTLSKTSMGAGRGPQGGVPDSVNCFQPKCELVNFILSERCMRGLHHFSANKPWKPRGVRGELSKR